MRELRIVFMGTPDFAVGVLKKLIEADKKIVGVITAPDRPAGRGQKLKLSAVKEYAQSKNLKILQPVNLKNEEFLDELKGLNANLQIIVAFRMLPKLVWNMPVNGTFNLHASLLPQYRGAAPINWAIINGENETGVTTFFIDEKIDTGEIIAKKVTQIEANETAGSLHDKLMLLGAELVLETIALIEEGHVNTVKQPKTDILKEAPKLTSDNTKINWSWPLHRIDAFIRGLSPYPSAWSLLSNDGKDFVKVKIYRAEAFVEKHKEPIGVIFTTKKDMKIAVKDGYLHIKEMQLPGKKKMEVSSLLNGYAFSKDAKLL
jgi:methionyl-tRNA formyltransferase